MVKSPQITVKFSHAFEAPDRQGFLETAQSHGLATQESTTLPRVASEWTKEGDRRREQWAHRQIVLNMHKQGFAMEVIAAATGMSADDLRKIIPPSTTGPAAP